MIIHQVLVTNQDPLDPGQDQNLVCHQSGAAERGLKIMLFLVSHKRHKIVSRTDGHVVGSCGRFSDARGGRSMQHHNSLLGHGSICRLILEEKGVFSMLASNSE